MAGGSSARTLCLLDEGVPANGHDHIKPAIGTVPLPKLTGARLDTFCRSLTDRGLSPGSVRRNHFLLRAALGRAVKWGMEPSNPADRATPPGLSRWTVSAPAVADVQRLIAATESSQPILAAGIALAAVTGARRGELCALRWSDFDRGRRLLTIARSLTVIDGVVTEASRRFYQRRGVAVDDAMMALLARHRADHKA